MNTSRDTQIKKIANDVFSQMQELMSLDDFDVYRAGRTHDGYKEVAYRVDGLINAALERDVVERPDSALVDIRVLILRKIFSSEGAQ